MKVLFLLIPRVADPNTDPVGSWPFWSKFADLNLWFIDRKFLEVVVNYENYMYNLRKFQIDSSKI